MTSVITPLDAAIQWGEGKKDVYTSGALAHERKWVEFGKVSENDGDVAARLLAAEIRRLQGGERPAVRAWMRCGDKRVKLAEVMSYERCGHQIVLQMRGGGNVYWSPDYDETAGVSLDDQVRGKVEELDGIFGAI